MVAEVDARVGKLIPDMVLYHSQDTHYDLLVKEDSRLALLGLLAGAASINSQTEKTKNEVKTNEDNFCENSEWKIVILFPKEDFNYPTSKMERGSTEVHPAQGCSQ